MKVPGGGDWKFPEDNTNGAMMFNMMNAAHEWKLPPSEFLSLPSQDKAMMIVYTNVMNKMRGAATSKGR